MGAWGLSPRTPLTLTTAIEQIQRRFTKILRGYHDYSNNLRVKVLNLQSLQLRRFHKDIIRCQPYKTFWGLG